MSEIKRFNGYKPVAEVPRSLLPIGGYIAKILKAKVDRDGAGRQRLSFCVDIIEGPYKDFFMQDYKSRQGGAYEAKYRGVYRITVPQDGITNEDYDIDRFNRTMGALEKSNPGYQWNWDETGLKGLVVGLSVRESVFNDSLFTEIGKFIPVSIIREGHFRPMRRRISQNSEQETAEKPLIPGTNDYMREQKQTAQTSAQNPTSVSDEFADAEDCPF